MCDARLACNVSRGKVAVPSISLRRVRGGVLPCAPPMRGSCLLGGLGRPDPQEVRMRRVRQITPLGGQPGRSAELTTIARSPGDLQNLWIVSPPTSPHGYRVEQRCRTGWKSALQTGGRTRQQHGTAEHRLDSGRATAEQRLNSGWLRLNSD